MLQAHDTTPATPGQPLCFDALENRRRLAQRAAPSSPADRLYFREPPPVAPAPAVDVEFIRLITDHLVPAV